MPDQFTARLRLTDMANGEHDTTWADVTDKNFNLIEQAVAGVSSVDCAGAGDITLTAGNGVDDTSRAATLILTGIRTGSGNVVAPTSEKKYTVYNNTTGAFTLTLKTAAGAGVLIPQGRKMDVYCDAVDVLSGADSFSSLDVAGVTTSRGAVNESLAAAIASAATTNIWVTDGNTVHITGSTGPITSLGTAPRAGACRTVIFDSTPTLTNGGNLILPTAADIVVAAGDSMEVLAETTTQFRVKDYMRADGSPLTIPTMIPGARTFTSPATFQSNDAGAAEVVAVDLDRFSASPAASDLLMSLRWLMRSTTAAARVAARGLAKILTATDGAEDAELRWSTMRAGTLQEMLVFGKGGVYTPSATNGDQGADTFNAAGYYVNGVLAPRGAYRADGAGGSVGVGDIGGVIKVTSAGTYNLVTTATLKAGHRTTLWNASGGVVTIDPSGAQTIDGLATRDMGDGDRVDVESDGSNWFTVRGSYSFKSAELAVDNISATVAAHGLGMVPNRVRMVLRYKGAGELGYVAGQEIPWGGDYADQATSAAGVQIVVDDTNVTLLQATIQVKVLNKTTPAGAVVITTADWKFEIQAMVQYG